MIQGKGALLQKLGDDLIAFYRVKFQLAAAKTVAFICHQVIQGNHRVISGQVSGNVVRVSDAHIWGGFCGNVGNDIIVDLAVIGVKPQVYSNIGIQGLEIGDGLFVNFRLGFVGVVFGPEGDFIVLGGIKFFRDGKCALLLCTVTAASPAAKTAASARTRSFFPGNLCFFVIILLYLLLKPRP